MTIHAFVPILTERAPRRRLRDRQPTWTAIAVAWLAARCPCAALAGERGAPPVRREATVVGGHCGLLSRSGHVSVAFSGWPSCATTDARHGAAGGACRARSSAAGGRWSRSWSIPRVGEHRLPSRGSRCDRCRRVLAASGRGRRENLVDECRRDLGPDG